MDIDYLIFLQNLRESTGDFFSPFLSWVSKFSVGFWPIAIMCIVYWVFDRKGGKRILAGFGCGLLMNGFLKLVFCVYRPWIRDPRVEPYGDSKVAATGYSFPSGHSTFATATFGGVGVWARKRNKFISCILFILVILTLFSRNYLGVHTPQDVIVGFCATALIMFIAAKIENWTDENPERDKIVIIGGIIICIALALFYEFKSYPLTYLSDGSLLVDPKKMKADSFEGLGFIFSFVICRYFERRNFSFDTEIEWKDRFIIGVLALVPLYVWFTYVCPFIMADISRPLGKFAYHAFFAFYTLIVVPYAMKKISVDKFKL